MPNIRGLLDSITDMGAKTKVTMKQGDQTITVERAPEQSQGMTPNQLIGQGMGLLDNFAQGTGGMVPGQSPTPVADDVPANLTSGEFVVNQPAAQKYSGLLEDINNEGREILARGGYVGDSKVNNYAMGGGIQSKVEKIMRYNMGGRVMPKYDDYFSKAFDRGFAQGGRVGYNIGGQVDAAAQLQGQVAGGAGGFGSNPYLERQQQLQDRGVARVEQLSDVADQRAYQQGITQDQRAYQQGITQDQRAYNEGLTGRDRAYAEGLTGDQRAYNEQQDTLEYEREQAELVAQRNQVSNVSQQTVTRTDGTQAQVWVGERNGLPVEVDINTGSAQPLQGDLVQTTELGSNLQRDINTVQATADEATADANGLAGLFSAIDSAPGTDGVVRAIEIQLEEFGGWQGAQALWETQFNKLALKEALKGKPPGPITEKELELLYRGVPSATSNPETKLRWIRAAMVASTLQSASQSFKAAYMQRNGGSAVGWDKEWDGSPEKAAVETETANIVKSFPVSGEGVEPNLSGRSAIERLNNPNKLPRWKQNQQRIPSPTLTANDDGSFDL